MLLTSPFTVCHSLINILHTKLCFQIGFLENYDAMDKKLTCLLRNSIVFLKSEVVADNGSTQHGARNAVKTDFQQLR